ncbi:hypothetical protein pb186bvf_013042 [Paramecium bursaria]
MSQDDLQLLLQMQQMPIPSPVYDYEKISDQEFSNISDSVIPVQSNESSDSSQSSKKKKRWKYCCEKCTKSDKGSAKPKTCVCIVPATQRRIQIGEGGCLTCQCTGCSIEDKKKKKIKKKKSDSSSSEDFKTVNGCCKKCMKAFSKKGKEAKSCLCQVPRAVRKKPLPAHGCQYCGCHGCNPEDRKKALSPISQEDQNLNNFQRSNLYRSFQNPAFYGFGVPQRTYSYIYGYPYNQ